MRMLQILVGLPASGKTTYAYTLVAKGWTRVNRDDLRMMLHAGAYSPETEELVKNIEAYIITEALRLDRNVVIDDTNMSPGIVERWSAIANSLFASIVITKFDTSIEECIRRDVLREHPVGEEVIRRIAREGNFESGGN